MKTPVPLMLQKIVIDGCPFAAEDFRHRVGEISAAAGPDMNLDNARLASLPHNDQISWVRGHGPMLPRRNEDQIDRFFDYHALGNKNPSTVLDERRIEGNKRLLLVTNIARQMGLQNALVTMHGICQAFHSGTRG